MILLRKTLLWSLPVWSFLLVCSSFFFASTSNIIEPIGTILAVIQIPGFILAILLAMNVHNFNVYLVVITNCLIYSCLLYLCFSIKAKFKGP